jgi:hypothetical protein
MPRKQQPRVARQITRQLDDVLAKANIPSRPRIGWIATIRQALGMSKTQLAKRVDIARLLRLSSAVVSLFVICYH